MSASACTRSLPGLVNCTDEVLETTIYSSWTQVHIFGLSFGFGLGGLVCISSDDFVCHATEQKVEVSK